MSTKIAPGAFDYYRSALPDEPYFLLLARDTTAPARLREWADEHRRDLLDQKLSRPEYDDDKDWLARWEADMAKCREADLIAHDMVVWRANNDGAWRHPEDRPAMGEINPALKDAVAEVTKSRVCSALVLGAGQVQQVQHHTRPWSMPGFNCRIHTISYESTSDAFAPIVEGRELVLDDWRVTGFDVLLGDVQHHADSANKLWVRLQTVEVGS